jgi:hypothetical protein
VDVRFFRGRGATREPLPDEVFLDCGDGYFELPEKVKAVCTWAYDQGYDLMAKIDDDVQLRVTAFLGLIGAYDYMGACDINGSPADPAHAQGYCYVLSRKAMGIIKDSTLPREGYMNRGGDKFNDEQWVCHMLSSNGIFLHGVPHTLGDWYITPEARFGLLHRGSEQPTAHYSKWCVVAIHVKPDQDKLAEINKVAQELGNARPTSNSELPQPRGLRKQDTGNVVANGTPRFKRKVFPG